MWLDPYVQTRHALFMPSTHPAPATTAARDAARKALAAADHLEQTLRFLQLRQGAANDVRAAAKEAV